MTLSEKYRLVWRSIIWTAMLTLVILSSCSGDDDPPVKPEPEPEKISVNLSESFQEMIGFGGALSWYSDRVMSSSKKNEIADLIFNDLGADIIRLKTWYYPDNYPDVTSTTSMSDDNSKAMWDVTNQLHQLAKAGDPGVKILLSSWGPPAALKSNDKTREGTLKKDANGFMYDAFADYWEDLLDHLPFNPEYLSIQNEPTYANPGWTTCQWAATETATLPGYDIAFDKVYEKLQGRTSPPMMIGPESQDVPTFAAFAQILKNKPHAELFAYHPYNINAGTAGSQIESSLKSIASHDARPNIMTEYSDNLTWFNTAVFIHNTLVHANSSGYIYWKLVWAQPAGGSDDAGMVSINSSGDYTVTPFYYLIKHFAKHIDAGYKRVAVTSSKPTLDITAFVNPAQTQVTVVVINNTSNSAELELEVAGKTINGVNAVQSKEGDYYNDLENATPGSMMSFPPKSITTVVIDI